MERSSLLSNQSDQYGGDHHDEVGDDGDEEDGGDDEGDNEVDGGAHLL